MFPRSEVVAIAEETGQSTLAIDPESEQMNPSVLSKADMEVVSLWTFTPSTVTPENADPHALRRKPVAG